MEKQHLKNLLIKIGIALCIVVLTWALFLIFVNYVLIAVCLPLVSIPLTIVCLKKDKIVRRVALFLNPFVFITVLSFTGGVVSVLVGNPTLTFVCYHLDDLPPRDIQIENRTSIDPEFGLLDYMVAVPGNIGVRLMMSFTDKLDHRFWLVYRDELPYSLNLR